MLDVIIFRILGLGAVGENRELSRSLEGLGGLFGKRQIGLEAIKYGPLDLANSIDHGLIQI